LDKNPGLEQESPDCQNSIGGRVLSGGAYYDEKEEDGVREPAPRPGERVLLVNTADMEQMESITDGDGHYAFPNLCSGTYWVCVAPICPTEGSAVTPSYRPGQYEQTVAGSDRIFGLDFVWAENPDMGIDPMDGEPGAFIEPAEEIDEE
jgi:hypothetical protein